MSAFLSQAAPSFGHDLAGVLRLLFSAGVTGDWPLHSVEYHADEPPKVTGSGPFCLMRSSGKLGFYVFL